MPLCQDRRGEFKDMQYLDTHLVELHYQMPLNEIIYDFFDTLKVGSWTVPRLRIFFLPSFCFSSSFFFRVMSPP